MSYFLERKETLSTPYVLIDEAKGYMKMAGKSFPEKAMEFYRDINDWLESHLQTEFGKFTFDFAMEYYNSSTYKIIVEAMTKMDKYAGERNKITINWMAPSDDDIAIESGEDLKEDLSNVDFNLIIE